MKHLLQFNRFMVMMVAMLTMSVTQAFAATIANPYVGTPAGSASKDGGNITLSDVTWSYGSATFLQIQNSMFQIGSKNNPQTSGWTISTSISSFGKNVTITKVKINAKTGGAGSYDISVGGTSQKSGNLTTSATDYETSTLAVTEGNVAITITGATKAAYLGTITITYTTGGGTDPEISLTGDLKPFTYVAGQGPSAEQTIVLKGSNLTENVEVQAPEGYECRLEDETEYSSTLSLNADAVMEEDGVSIYVHLAEGLMAGTFNGTLTASSDGAEDAEIELTGSVTVLVAPSFTTQPVAASYEQGATPVDLSVVAAGNPAPTYQWYSNTTQSTEGATLLTGATTATYTPSTATIGTTYYYCVATNSKGSATSEIVAVEVTEHVITPGAYDIVPNNVFFNCDPFTSKPKDFTDATGTQNDITIKYTAASNAYINAAQCRMYDGTKMDFTVPAGYQITAIAFTADGNNWAGAHTCNVGAMTGNKNWAGKANSVTITFKGTCRCTSIKVTYAIDNQVATPVFKINDAEVIADAEYCGAQEVAISCATDGAAISYSTDNGSTWNAYSAPIEVTATATLQAKATKTGLTDSEVNTKAFTINAPIANTKETAYTTAQAIAIINADKCLQDTVFVKGTISQIDKFNESYSSITYWLDNNTFEVYSGKGLNGADFSSIDDIKVGAEVIVKGIIKKYVGSSTIYEFDKNNYLVAYEEPETPKTTATISLSGYKQTLAMDDAANVVTISYNGDGVLAAESSDPAIASVALTVNETDTFVTVTPVAAGGPVTITVSAPATEAYTAASKNYSLTINPALAAANLPFTFDGGKNDINPANGIKHSGLGSDYSSAPKLKFDTQDDYVIVKIAEKAVQLSYTIKGNGFSNGTFDVLESADDATYTTLKSYTTLGDATTDTVTPAEASRYFKFVYTSKSSGNVALGAINIIATLPKKDPQFSIQDMVMQELEVTAPTISRLGSGTVTYNVPENNYIFELNGEINAVNAGGPVTVTAYLAETDEYLADTTTFDVTVEEASDYKTAEYTTFTNLKDSLGQLGQYQAYNGGGTADAKIKDGQIYLYQPAQSKNFGGYITIAALPGLKIAKIDFKSAMGTTYNYKVDGSNTYASENSIDIEADEKETIASLSADSVRIYCLGASSSYRLYLSYLKVYYSGELENFNLAVAGATKTEYEIGETIDHTGAVVTATFENAGARDVTINSTFTDPDMSTAGTKQVAANFGGKSATYDITVTAPTPTIEVDADAVDFGTVAKGASVSAKKVAVTLTAVASATVTVTGEGKDAFLVTPESLSASGDITITPVTTTEGTFAATITISAAGAESKTIALSMAVDANTDVLTASGIGQTSYGDWSNKTFTTTTKYAGNSTTGTQTYAGAIQIRSTNNSGIVSTKTMGYIKSVSIDFNSLPAIGKSVDIYGSNVAYASAADLAGNNPKGTKIGSATADGTVTLAEGNYKYIGVRSSGGAIYMNSISIAWTPATFYAIALTQTDNGKVVINTDAAAEGETVTLTATPDANFSVASWTGLPEGATVSEDKNTVSFSMPAEALTISATFGQAYVRENTTDGNYGVICLPMAVSAGNFQGAEVFKIVEKDADVKNLTIETVESMEAGRAYIILSNAENFTCMMTGDAVTIAIAAADNYGLAGTLTGTSFTGDGSQYVIVNNKVMKAGQVNIGANKAWIEMESVPAAGQGAPQRAGSRRITLGSNGVDTPTGLDALFMQEGIRKMVIDGQLIIIRDGKMFNAQGQNVK